MQAARSARPGLVCRGHRATPRGLIGLHTGPYPRLPHAVTARPGGAIRAHRTTQVTMEAMSERKPAGMSFGSWIDEQIRQAEERGAFDDLPGAGKPLPKRNEDAAQAWLREYLRREGIPADELLPTPLKLRKEIERLGENAPLLSSEDQVREVASELNHRIVQWRRFPSGPQVFVPLVDTEAMVGRWREAHRPGAADSGSPSEDGSRTGEDQAGRPAGPSAAVTQAGSSAKSRRWFRRPAR